MKKHILTILLLAGCLLANSQHITKIYYDNNWKTIKATDTVAYYRLVKLDSKCRALDTIRDYYADGKLQAKIDGALFVDTLSDLNTKYTGNGLVYYESGARKSKVIRNDTGTVLSNMGWYETGKLWFTDHYEKGKKEDTGRVYYMNGAIMIKQPYTNDKRNGIEHTYTKDGTLVTEATYVTGLLNGPAKSYYESGKVKEEATYVNDTIEGIIKYYYINGKRQAEIQHLKGKIDGTCTLYAENGDLKSTYEYKAGKLNGEVIEYWENKLLKRRDRYRNDTLMDGKCYDKTGKEESYYRFFADGPMDANFPDFTDVRQMPEFKGNINEYLSNNIKYPKKEQKNNITGTVYIKFIIERDGSISNVTVLKGVSGGPGLDAEAVSVISNMPKWRPGMQNGQAVRVSYNIPIRFTLQ